MMGHNSNPSRPCHTSEDTLDRLGDAWYHLGAQAYVDPRDSSKAPLDYYARRSLEEAEAEGCTEAEGEKQRHGHHIRGHFRHRREAKKARKTLTDAQLAADALEATKALTQAPVQGQEKDEDLRRTRISSSEDQRGLLLHCCTTAAHWYMSQLWIVNWTSPDWHRPF